MVTGYQGGSEIDLGVERGEIQCRAMSIEAFFAREPFHTWRKRGFVRSIIQTGRKRDAKLLDVPTIFELMDQYQTPDQARRFVTVVLSVGAVGRPMVGAPGIPADRVKLLRSAFASALKDPELIAEAKRRNFGLEPVSGEDMEALAKEVIAQPPEVIGQLRRLLGK
jgi:hypothetical protein